MTDQHASTTTRRSFLRLAAGGAAVAAGALAVAAPDALAKDARVDRRIALAATANGRKIGASGYARVRSRDGRQTFNCEAEARVAAGTRYAVFVTNGGQTVRAGTIRITSVGEGEIELKNYDGKTLPAGVAPVTGITRVTVQDSAGRTILSGSF